MTPDDLITDEEDDLDDDLDSDGWPYEEDLDEETCQCPYCYCGQRPEAGLICNDCLGGAHQG